MTPADHYGPWRPEKLLGRGGMGEVWEAVDDAGRVAALKVITEDPTDETAMRFEREARVLGEMRHPGVVGAYGHGRTADGRFWLAMERLRGGDLAARLARGPLPPHEAASLGRAVCDALALAHGRGVIHRDLKPGNLFMTDDGQVKLLDFGLAMFLAESRKTRVGMILGTPQYMSPEQARGDADIDARTDLYSLGVVLYEALCGDPPFDGAPLAVLVKVLMEEMLPLRKRRPDLPPDVMGAVERAVSKDRDRRFATAEEMGRALEETAARAPAPRPTVERRAPSTLGVERRVVAVLLAERVADAERVTAVARAQGGLVERLIGGRVVALFGSERWEGDEALRAVRAALGAAGAAGCVGVGLGRALLRRGEVSAEAIAMAERAAASGASVRGASVRDAGVVVDEETFRSVRGAFEAEALGERLFRVRAERAAAEIIDFARGGEEIPCVGRDAELAQIASAWEGVADERRAAGLLLVGPPGIGKSRLVYEFALRLDAAGAAPARIEIRCGALERMSPFAALAQALRAQAGFPRDAPADEKQRRLHTLTIEAGVGGETPDCAAFLGAAAGVDFPATPALRAAREDAQIMRRRILASVEAYAGALARRGPLLLVVEDIQWVDAATMEAIEWLLDRLAEAPLFVLLTARAEALEERPDLLADRGVRRLDLAPLRRNDATRLVRALAPAAAEDLCAAIAERSGGVPLFAEALALEARERGSVGADLPVSIDAAVQSRLDHLPAPEKELMKRASVLGRAFWEAALAALGAEDPARHLASLRKRDLVTPRLQSRFADTPEWTVRSHVVAEVAYRMIPDDARALLHRQAAEWLVGRAEADPAEIAHHFERAGDAALAGEWLVRAAQGAARSGSAQVVVEAATRALATVEDPALRFDLLRLREEAHQWLARPEERARDLADMEAVAGRLGDPRRRGIALRRRGEWLFRSGAAADAARALKSAVEFLDAAGEPGEAAFACLRRVHAALAGGALAEARDLLGEAERRAFDVGSPLLQAAVADAWANTCAHDGDFAGALSYADAARDHYEQAGELERATVQEAVAGYSLARLGRYEDAAARLAPAAERARSRGQKLVEGWLAQNLCLAMKGLGRVDEALGAADRAIALALDARDRRLEAAARIYRGEALVAAGRADEGEREAEAARALAGESDQRGLEAEALRVVALARLARGQAAPALEASTRAVALLDRMGSHEESEVALLYAHARALAAFGRADRARQTLERAANRLAELADRIGDDEMRRSFVEAVPEHRAVREAIDRA